MEMKLRKGAIVSFCMAHHTLAPFSCKIIDANENEIIVVEQAYVSMKEIASGSGIKTQDLNHRLSVDFGCPVSLPKSNIRTWHQSTIPNDTTLYYSAYRPSDVCKMPQDRVNSYDATGICKGYGEDLE